MSDLTAWAAGLSAAAKSGRDFEAAMAQIRVERPNAVNAAKRTSRAKRRPEYLKTWGSRPEYKRREVRRVA